MLNRDGINSHKRLEKYLSIQRAKGGADKNPTEKFNQNAAGDKLVPV